jgi:pyroglutamyl-peptidase
MKKLLITGFEPFGGESINPSMEAVLKLPQIINGYSVSSIILPVVFGKAAKKAIAAANDLRPDVILCIGQAGGRNAVTPELLGINLRYATIPDNEQNMPSDEPIIPEGNAAYFSTLPVRSISQALKDSGIPSYVSCSAGTYVCNDLLYSLLAHFDKSNTRVGFVHIPYSVEQGKEPSMTMDDIIRGITVVIESLDLDKIQPHTED